jgi:hypothetical protein
MWNSLTELTLQDMHLWTCSCERVHGAGIMTAILSAILSVSLVALIFGSVSLELKRWRARRLLATGTVIAIALGIFILDAVQTKSPAEDITAVVFCYAAMLLGMVAHGFYTRREQGTSKVQLDPLQLLLPTFASPIVFIPLLTMTTGLSAGSAFTTPTLMVYLVAFQNGFFWKTFFGWQHRPEEVESASAQPVEFTPRANPQPSRTK